MADTVETIRAALASGRADRRLIMTEQAWYADAVPLPEGTIRRWSVGVHALTDDGQDDGTYGQWRMAWPRAATRTTAARAARSALPAPAFSGGQPNPILPPNPKAGQHERNPHATATA